MIKTFKNEEYELFSLLAHNKGCWDYFVNDHDDNGMMFAEPTIILQVNADFIVKFFDLEILKHKTINLVSKGSKIFIDTNEIIKSLEAEVMLEILETLK